MSYTFNVSYKNTTKKISCARSATINDLIQSSFDKFKIANSNNGELTYSGKKLDGLLPVRLTNLVNNAKLVLSVIQGVIEVSLKVAASISDTSVTKIIKVSPSASLSALVGQFKAEADIQTDWSDKRVQLSLLQTIKDNLTSNFDEITVGSLVGSSANAVVRLLVENKDVQQKRAKLHEEQRILRQELAEKKRQERIMQKQELEERMVNEREQISEQKHEEKDVSMEGPKQFDPTQSKAIPAAIKPSGQTTETTYPNSSEESNRQSISESKPQTKSVQHFSATTMVSSTPEHEEFQVPEEKEDTLYIPQSRTTYYENPEEDYNLTVNQAEKYYKMIKSMQGAPVAKKEAATPTKYVIRIRFPDRSLLDLPIEDVSMKLGQFLKKIDNYVADRFVNTYKIKNGSPPFKEIAMGFTENNIPLESHPDFQLEKLLLIWEPAQKHAVGPYLKEGITTKDASELPTLLLESNRGHLEQNEVSIPTPTLALKSHQSEKQKLNGVPKWFKK